MNNICYQGTQSLKKEGDSCQLRGINACSLERNQCALLPLHPEVRRAEWLVPAARTGILVFLAPGRGMPCLGAP